MAKTRVVNTRFWTDPWVMEELNPLDKFLFLYFLTNDQTNLSGIYEISIRKICFETGIEKETLIKSMLPRLEPKVYFKDDWVIIPNFPKHQSTDNPKIMAGIQRELENVPEEIYSLSIGYGYPIHRLSHLTKLNLTKPIGRVSYETPSSEEELEIPTLEEYIQEQAEEEWVDDQQVWRRNGKPVSIKTLEKEYTQLYKAPVALKKAPRTRDHYDFDTWLMSLGNSEKKLERIIAFVWKERGYRFDNYEQWRARLGQDVKYARELEGYKASEVQQVIDELNEEEVKLGYKWSMSTVAKRIANVVSV